GDLSKKITVDVKGEILELKNTINTMVDQLRSFASEVTRVAREVGTEGRLGGQADVKGVAGTWRDLTESVNFMAGNLTSQVRNIADVTKAVASGDLSKKITVDVKGEILELKNTINTMVDQLSSFASEVTRVAREVGTEGMLGGQADVRGVAGTWKDLTDSVNSMGGNLTSQVRGIAKVVTAVANGDLQQKLTVEAKGEIAALSDTINSMIDTLATFADQVTTVAREVGVEGKLGGQAKVPGAAGTWKGLTENVNQLAANLTTQVRAIAEVATAVTQGNLTRSITVEARGEVAALKDTINEMIRNLRDTTHKNTETDWLKTNLAKFSRMLQGQKDLNTVCRLILSELAPVVSAQHGLFYVLDSSGEASRLTLLASYGSSGQSALGSRVELGEGLIGQCAADKEKILLSNVPLDYIRIFSGLGSAPPQNILVLPVIFEGRVKGVLELASFDRFSPAHEAFLDQLTESIGIVINTIEANTRTEDLLAQSQSLAQELQSRQQELQQTNQELEEKAGLLAHQNQEVERKNREVEQARKALEEKAEQLALTSKYKSEFLANMSHELRTPLNSLLILSDQLCKNPGGNLTEKQVEFAKTIHASGNDLLTLINDILDLSKIESGTVVVDPTDLLLGDMERYVERTFRHVAEAKGLDFFIRMDSRLPVSMLVDAKRLQQVLKNLLSNAFKFTHRGHVTLTVEHARTGWDPDNENLNRAGDVIAFSVVDTGIGISPDKQQIIFEAFQQADGSTSRKYGGTGLGLAISRELARVLGGELRLTSAPRVGSTFTLYLPQIYTPPRITRKAAPVLPAKAALAAPEPADDEAAREPEPRARRDGPPAPPDGIVPETAESAGAVNEVGDDRDDPAPGVPVLLIVENDLGFARFLLDAARERGFKGIVTSLGVSALAMAAEYKPAAVTLDIYLPDIDGWRVLDRLKHDVQTRHIPVAVVSTDDARERALNAGAFKFLAKPIQSKDVLDQLLDGVMRFIRRTPKNVLAVTPDGARRDWLTQYLRADDVEVTVSPGFETAVAMVEGKAVDCLVVDASLPPPAAEALVGGNGNGTGVEPLPVVLFGAAGDPGRLSGWQSLAKHRVVREARSAEDLLDQASFFLHRTPSHMPEAHRKILRELRDANEALRGKRAMIVDDDMRNIFALTSLLEDRGMTVTSHDNGREAVKALAEAPQVDVILMDIMMPEMDGIDTIREIRRIPACKHVPIIAVTAKAMKGDREKCMEAGAWDYLSKPVDTELMVGVLRAWLG
ncbi:MAG TPA: response regulator, partial [Casimicrobiaceae bacterium]|nr:response regulator [Casimicrobiaceae bacterium]